jgi:hypothetical protein
MRDWRLGRVVTIVDRGMSSEANLDYLTRAGGHYIAGERMRSGAPLVEQACRGRAATPPCGTTCASRKSASTAHPGRRWIICHNPDEAEREKATRDAALARLAAELDRITAMRERATRTAKGKRRPLRRRRT